MCPVLFCEYETLVICHEICMKRKISEKMNRELHNVGTDCYSKIYIINISTEILKWIIQWLVQSFYVGVFMKIA